MRAGAGHGRWHRGNVRPSFVSFDFELANSSHASICSAGVARVVDGEVTDTRHWFCRPTPPFDRLSWRNMQLTGIRPTDLAGVRGFDWLGPHLVRNIGEGIVVGHGMRSADLSMFEQSWHAARLGPAPTWRYVCTLEVARTLYPNLPQHRLNTLTADLLGETLDGHHSADVDARASARLLLVMLERSGTTLDQWVRVRRGRPFAPPRPFNPAGMIPLPDHPGCSPHVQVHRAV